MDHRATTLADFYRASSYADFPQEVRSVGSDPVSFLRAQQSAHDFTDPPYEELVLVLCIGGSAPFRWNIGDGWSEELSFRAGDISVVPPLTSVEYDIGDDHEVLTACLPLGHLSSLLRAHGAPGTSAFGALHDAIWFRDEIIAGAIRTMWLEAANHGAASSLLVNGLSHVVAAQLLRRAGHALPDPTGGKLSPEMLRRVEEFIRANLDQALVIADLACLADLPETRFTLELKSATGLTPHQFLISLRIAHAQELLAAGDMPLAEVAYACGFASQSHMTDVFRNKLGVTPGRYRKEVRG